MRRLIALLTVVVVLGVGLSSAEIIYTSDIKTDKTPAITMCCEGKVFLSYTDDSDTIYLARGILRTTEGQVVKIGNKVAIGNETPDHPDLGFFNGQILMGWNEDDGNVYLALFKPEEMTRTAKFEYRPNANNPISVTSFYEGLILNTWTSKDKPGLTLIVTKPKVGDDFENLIDNRYSEFEPKEGSSVAYMGDVAIVAWRDDKNVVHITRWRFQQNEITKALSVIGYKDNEMDFKTEVDPAVVFGDDGKLYITWYNKGMDLIECASYDVSSQVINKLDHKNFEAGGCKGLDITYFEGNPYIAYTDGEGIIKVAKIM